MFLRCAVFFQGLFYHWYVAERLKALKLIFTIKETRLCGYTNKYTQVNLFFKFFVTVKLMQAITLKVMNN